MDTRFWGPPGWKLLHAIASSYADHPHETERHNYKTWFRTLPHLLPCIYCRRSLTQYYKELPIEGTTPSKCPFLNRMYLMQWLYDIHNKVNDKLRGQGLYEKPDPKFKTCCNRYRKREAKMACRGWDFLYAIVLNYPEDPKLVTMVQEMNIYLFFSYLPRIFPDKQVASRMQPFMDRYPVRHFLTNRRTLAQWLYMLEKKTCTSPEKCKCFESRCYTVEKYRAGCKGNEEDDAPTCRTTHLIEKHPPHD